MNVDKRKPEPAEDAWINAVSRLRILESIGRLSTAELYLLATLAGRLEMGRWADMQALQAEMMDAVIDATTAKPQPEAAPPAI